VKEFCVVFLLSHPFIPPSDHMRAAPWKLHAYSGLGRHILRSDGQ